MARFRLSRPAQADIAHILATSAQRWGDDGRHRYAALLAAAMRRLLGDPQGPATRQRAELAPDLRSFHIRHARGGRKPKVGRPVHVIYYRVVQPELIEIVRVLHERMEPRLHISED